MALMKFHGFHGGFRWWTLTERDIVDKEVGYMTKIAKNSWQKFCTNKIVVDNLKTIIYNCDSIYQSNQEKTFWQSVRLPLVFVSFWDDLGSSLGVCKVSPRWSRTGSCTSNPGGPLVPWTSWVNHFWQQKKVQRWCLNMFDQQCESDCELKHVIFDQQCESDCELKHVKTIQSRIGLAGRFWFNPLPHSAPLGHGHCHTTLAVPPNGLALGGSTRRPTAPLRWDQLGSAGLPHWSLDFQGIRPMSRICLTSNGTKNCSVSKWVLAGFLRLTKDTKAFSPFKFGKGVKSLHIFKSYAWSKSPSRLSKTRWDPALRYSKWISAKHRRPLEPMSNGYGSNMCIYIQYMFYWKNPFWGSISLNYTQKIR